MDLRSSNLSLWYSVLKTYSFGGRTWSIWGVLQITIDWIRMQQGCPICNCCPPLFQGNLPIFILLVAYYSWSHTMAKIKSNYAFISLESCYQLYIILHTYFSTEKRGTDFLYDTHINTLLVDFQQCLPRMKLLYCRVFFALSPFLPHPRKRGV